MVENLGETIAEEYLGGSSDGWDIETDLLVFGSGAAGLSAALFAVKKGLRVVLCEKSAQIGGTTATSAGMIWIPGNRQAREDGIEDSIERAQEYLKHELGNYYREDLVEPLLESGPEAIAELEQDTEVEFHLSSSPDYHPDQVGGVDKGRVLVVHPFDGRRLGADFALLRPPMPRMMVLGGMMVQADDISAFLNPFSSVDNFRLASRRLVRYVSDRLRYPRGTEIANGNSLVARFLYSLKARNAVIWTGSPLIELVRNGRVYGAIVDRNGVKTRVQAMRGVFLATGGFPSSSSFRKTLAAGHPHSTRSPSKGILVVDCRRQSMSVHPSTPTRPALDSGRRHRYSRRRMAKRR